jgi:hypothetical protein
MENFNKQPNKTRVEEVRDVILRSPAQIEEEFQRTANSWLACFRSSVFVIETYLFGKKAEDELGTKKFNTIQKKLEILKQRIYDLEQQYPDKNTTPPDEIKRELLDMLNILK